MRTVLALAALTGVYLLALASVAPADVAAGVAVAAAALAVARRAPGNPRTGSLRSLPALVPFLAAILVDVARGTWEVALVVLGVRRLRAPGTVEIPIGERTELGTVVSTLASTLSPGEVLIDIDHERGVYLIHALDAGDPDALRTRHRHGYERRQRKAVP
jgi:multisubunit Na+/H+ antiporter MnhE subunit